MKTHLFSLLLLFLSCHFAFAQKKYEVFSAGGVKVKKNEI
jgi:hypothetical protein